MAPNTEVKRFDIPVVAPEFRIQEKTGTTRSKRTGSVVREMAVATYDVTGGDSGVAGTFNTGIFIPANAIITNVFIDVVTTFTDGVSDSATIGVGYTGAAAAFTAAIAVSDASNVWDAGLHGTILGTAAIPATATAIVTAAAIASSRVKITAEKQVIVTVATATLTAGKMNIFVEYYISD